MSAQRDESHPPPDVLLADIADYVVATPAGSATAYAAARACLLDALACALRSLQHPDCVRVLGPVVPGATMIGGARVIGTSYELDPVHAAFNLGTMIRWCAEARADAPRECHPADALGAILAVADWRSRRASVLAEPSPTVRDVLSATIMSHEIQAALVAASGRHALGRDDVHHVSVASAAVVAALLGGTRAAALAAISHACVDGGPWRAVDDAGSAAVRDRWAVGDAASRGVRHALRALAGEPACSVAASAAARELPGLAAPCEPPLGCGRLEATMRRTVAPAEPEAQQRLRAAAAAHYSPKQAAAIAALCADSAKLDDLAVHDLVSALVKN